MTVPDSTKVYPRTGDPQTVYLKNAVQNTHISVGDFTIYNDFAHDPRDFERNNVLYHYPINGDSLRIGKFCSIACGAKFLMGSAHHAMGSLSTYTFPIFYEEWGHGLPVTQAWDAKGDLVVGNDVWIGYEAVIFAGVTIGDGAIIGTRAVVTHDVPPYSIVGGVPARVLRSRFPEEQARRLQALRWWDWPVERIKEMLPVIQAGDIVPLCAFAETHGLPGTME